MTEKDEWYLEEDTGESILFDEEEYYGRLLDEIEKQLDSVKD